MNKELLVANLKDALIAVQKDVKSFECLNDLIDTTDDQKQIKQVQLSAMLESLIHKLTLDVDYVVDILERNQ